MSRENGVPGVYIPYTKNENNNDKYGKNLLPETEDTAVKLELDWNMMDEHMRELCKKYIPRVAKFEKVPYEQFKEDIIKNHALDYAMDEMIVDMYDKIKLPKRSTTDSAGYDFCAPFYFKLEKDKSVIIPTGIRCKINPGWWLMLVPRSGSGFKYKVQLYNTVGVIDGDYYNAKNYGHIMIKLTAERKCEFKQGDAICQGIFNMYGITEDDEVSDIRVGGLGSTDVVKNQETNLSI